jgi:hypothetical protein
VARTVEHFGELAALVEVERAAQREARAAERERLPLAEREAMGTALADLAVVDERAGLGGRLLVTVERSRPGPLETRLGVGDVVEVSRRAAVGDRPLRAVVARRTATALDLAFERPPPPDALEGRLVLELAPDEATFDRARAALRQVAAGEKGPERRRRDVLLGLARARFGPAPAEDGAGLDPEQREAVARALAAEDVALVHGPPGTGKSTVLVEVARRAVARGDRVLVAAASNAAVDHLLGLCLDAGLPSLRIGHPARVSARIEPVVLDARVEAHPDARVVRELLDEAWELQGFARKQRRQGRSRDRWQNAREARARARALLDEARALERRLVEAVLGRARVIGATLAGLAGETLARERFDLALVDEATEAIEPLSLLAFLRADRVVLAGDHRQLPPTVIAPEAARRGLSTSLFERLLADHGPALATMLKEGRRMSTALLAFPSASLYGGALRAHPAVAGRTLAERLAPGTAVDAPPVLFLDTAGKGFDEEVAPGTESLRNPGEAALVAARARELVAAGLPPAELAVIAPYRAQALRVAGLVPPGVEVDTVDAFQGREKDAVLITLTRSNPEGTIGFLADVRRMNVAITRARRHLFVVGDSATIGGHPFYRAFLDHVESAGAYRSAWSWPEP